MAASTRLDARRTVPPSQARLRGDGGGGSRQPPGRQEVSDAVRDTNARRLLDPSGPSTTRADHLLAAAHRGPLSATAYGVPADGRRDAAGPLQALLNVTPPGATVTFPAGDYLLGARVWLTRPLTLRGMPGSRFFTDGRGHLPACFSVAAHEVTLRGLTLVGAGHVGVGIDGTVAPVAHLTIRDCVLSGMEAAGIQVGFHDAPCRHVRIAGNTVAHCRFPISLLFNCSGAAIVGNVVTASPQRGIMLNLLSASTGPRDVLIQGNRVEANGHTGALSIEGGNDVQVLDNHWTAANGIFGFYAAFTGTSASHTQVRIQGNTFLQATPHTGFCGVFGAANGIRLEANRFAGFYGGLGADPNCRYGNVVADNRFSGLTTAYEGTWLRGGWTFLGNVGMATPRFVPA